MNKKTVITILLALVAFSDMSVAKDLVVYIQYDKSTEPSYHVELEKAISDINLASVTYSIDQDNTIEEHAFRISSVISLYKENLDSTKVFLVSNAETSLVALEVLSRDTTIVALITLSGAFCDGDSYLYNKASIKKHMEMLDSVSFDGKTEQYLRTAYRMISQVKQGKKLKLPKTADDNMRELFALLNSRYGRSLLTFSLDEHLKKIRSWIVPLYQSKSQSSDLDLNIGKLIYKGTEYGVKFTEPNNYNDQNVGSAIARQVSNLLKK